MQVSITVGIGQDSAGLPIPVGHQVEALHHCIAQASNLFGGCTANQGLGGWVDDNGKLIVEPSVTFSILSDAIDVQDKAEQFAEICREAYNQTSVLLTVSKPALVKFLTGADAVPVG